MRIKPETLGALLLGIMLILSHMVMYSFGKFTASGECLTSSLTSAAALDPECWDTQQGEPIYICGDD